MQTLDVISVNIWQILISLCNLVLLFLILKKFLYKPVSKALKQRQDALEKQYEDAAMKEKDAQLMKDKWEGEMQMAKEKADDIVTQATLSAQEKGKAIIEDSKVEADRIRQRAKEDAVLEQKQAEATIKKEIVDVSAALSEKMLGREINTEDHRDLIDGFLSEIGEDDD